MLPSMTSVTMNSCALPAPPAMMICESLPSSILLAADSEKTGRWTDEEHAVFLQGLETHGKQWKVIAAMIGTRNVVQVRTHAQKYFQKLKRKQQNNSSVLSLQEESAEGAADATDIKNKKFKSSNGKPRIVIPASKQQCASQPPTPTAVTDLLDICPTSVAQDCSASTNEHLSTMISPTGIADFCEQDPLEWFVLMDDDGPCFPDLDLPCSWNHNHHTMDNAIVDLPLNITDPKVTVQSLFEDQYMVEYKQEHEEELDAEFY